MSPTLKVHLLYNILDMQILQINRIMQLIFLLFIKHISNVELEITYLHLLYYICETNKVQYKFRFLKVQKMHSLIELFQMTRPIR